MKKILLKKKYNKINNHDKISQKKFIVVHTHFMGLGGIGDFIRAAISFYSICKKNNFEYYVDFSKNKNLNNCFIIPTLPNNYLKLPKNEIIFNQTDFIHNKQDFIDKVKNNSNKINLLFSNAIGIEDKNNIIDIQNEFFNDILKPTNDVNNFINKVYNKYNISENNYISVHIRCGDKYIDTSNVKYLSNDSRINFNEENLFNKINKFILNFQKDHNINIPIIIHSDSNFLKEELKKNNNDYIILDLNIAHISENTGSKTIESFIETVGEFYIMAKSSVIYSPITYSGFAHMASIVNNKKIYINNEHGYYDLINTNNVVLYKLE